MSIIAKTLEKGLELDFDKMIEQEKKNSEQNNNQESKIPKLEELEEKYEDKDEDEFGMITDVLNIHQIYYRTLFKKNNKENMFEEINYDDKTSTNRSMELFYEYFYEYKTKMEKGEEYITVYTEDTLEQNKFEEIYGILINGDIKFMSPCIYSLYLLMAENKKEVIEWKKNNWKIIQVKSKES